MMAIFIACYLIWIWIGYKVQGRFAYWRWTGRNM